MILYALLYSKKKSDKETEGVKKGPIFNRTGLFIEISNQQT